MMMVMMMVMMTMLVMMETGSYSQPVPWTGRREAASHKARLGNTKGLKEQEP